MINVNGIEIKASATEAAAADIAELTPAKDPNGFQRTALDRVTDTPGEHTVEYNRQVARRSLGAVHLRAYIEAQDAAEAEAAGL